MDPAILVVSFGTTHLDTLQENMAGEGPERRTHCLCRGIMCC